MKNVTRSTNRSHRSGKRVRRSAWLPISLVWACALGALLPGVAVFHVMEPWKGSQDGDAGAAVPPTYCEEYSPAVKQGHTGHFRTGSNVSPASIGNAVARNLKPTIRLVSRTGAGPDISTAPTHGSVVLGSSLDRVGLSDIDLYRGRSRSFASNVIWNRVEGTSSVIQDEKTRGIYASAETPWESPVSVYDFLPSAPYVLNDCVLTHKDRFLSRFKGIDGRLTAIGDGLRTETIGDPPRSPRRLNWITDAAGRESSFGTHPATTRLDKIINRPKTGETTIETRGVLVFPCRCKRRPPRRGSRPFRVASRSWWKT